VAGILSGQEPTGTAVAILPADTSKQVRQLIRGMPLADKVDGVLLVPAGGRLASELRRSQLGGVFVRSEDWPGRGAGRRLVADLREAGRSRGGIPPLIAARQEGGFNRAFTDLPPAEAELQIRSPRVAERWAQRTAAALRDAGFHLNLAPVADVANLASPIADRSFGDDPALAAELTAAAVRGCKKERIACAVSHFPGLGAASGDTAEGPATVSLDAESLRSRDLLPFRAAFAERVPAVVLSLAFYAAYDPVTPASLSPAIAEDLLREELGFQGVAVTDDLTSGAIAAGPGAPQAAVDALVAGADLVLIGESVEARRARESVLDAARSGRISEQRLDQALARVLELKRKLGLLPPAPKGRRGRTEAKGSGGNGGEEPAQPRGAEGNGE
jgi:beta-N-acetylhexosaminidase